MNRILPLGLHMILGWVLALVTLGMTAFWLPAQVVDESGNSAIGGVSYLIFFVHYPSALNCLNFFLFAGLFSGVWLVRKRGRERLDLVTASVVEVGVLACTVTLVTGSIWAKAAWNMFWDFGDKRLMTVAIMWFTYVGLLAFRGALDDPQRRARFSAVFCVVATINVPLVYYSIKMFGQVSHPAPDANLLADFEMKVTRWFGAFAWFVLYTAVWRLRYRQLEQGDRLARLEESFARARI